MMQQHLLDGHLAAVQLVDDDKQEEVVVEETTAAKPTDEQQPVVTEEEIILTETLATKFDPNVVWSVTYVIKVSKPLSLKSV